VLAATRNRAVVPLLARGLHAGSSVDRALVIQCLVRRHDDESHHLLIREFGRLSREDQLVVRDVHLASPHRLATALKKALVHEEPLLCTSACQLIAFCHNFDLFPALVEAVEIHGSRDDRRSIAIANVIQQLAISLHDELADRPGEAKHAGRDPAFARRNVVVALERSLAHFADHPRRELVEAFALLAPHDNPLLARMLRDPRHPCHSHLCQSLISSTAPALVEQLVELLRDTDAPEAVLEAIARRTDRAFVEALLRNMKHPVSLRTLHNMKRLRAVAWLEDSREMLLEFDGRAQAIAIELAVASSIPADSLYRLLAMLAENGLAEGRRASCAALTRFKTREADALVRALLADPDAAVQAAALRQLRPRGFPDATKLIVEHLESSAVELRDAARAALAEFNYVRYRGMFDLLDQPAAQSTGKLVRQVDENSIHGLREDLASPSVSTRLRAIAMAIAMDAADDVDDQLISLACSENLELRQEAIGALGTCSSPRVSEALELAARDVHQAVREAAARSLEQFHARAIAVPVA
jgi:hypothetical protein